MAKKPDKTFTKVLTDWYGKNKRDLPWRADRDPYRVWVSEIMLQQTRVSAVIGYYHRFMEALPTVQDLAAADEEVLLKLWQGLGYYNRARNLQKAAAVITAEYGGRFPENYEEIKALPGIGEYTAGAVASICFDQKTAAVDGNVLRVMSRILNDHTDITDSSMKKRISAYLSALYPDSGCGEFTQSLIELGALICVPKGEPDCGNCPVADFCEARQAGTISELPVKKAQKKRKQIKKTVFLFECEGKIALQKRKAGALLGGLYEFPNVDEHMEAPRAMEAAQSFGLGPTNLYRSMEYTHVFTHVEWEMTAYHMAVEKPDGEFLWAERSRIDEEIPLPQAFGYFYEKI